MDLQLLPAVVEDIPTLVDIYMRSFKDEVATTCFPRSSPHVRKWWIDTNEEAIKTEPLARFLKIVNDKEEIMAWAKWNVPAQVGKEVSRDGDGSDDLPSWPQDADKELCNEFFGMLTRKKKELMGSRPHFCKPYLSAKSYDLPCHSIH